MITTHCPDQRRIKALDSSSLGDSKQWKDYDSFSQIKTILLHKKGKEATKVLMFLWWLTCLTTVYPKPKCFHILGALICWVLDTCFGEGNGNPLQCSCLENPMDGGAWWAAVYGVAQSRTQLKRLSSSSSRHMLTLAIEYFNTGPTAQILNFGASLTPSLIRS